MRESAGLDHNSPNAKGSSPTEGRTQQVETQLCGKDGEPRKGQVLGDTGAEQSSGCSGEEKELTLQRSKKGPTCDGAMLVCCPGKRPQTKASLGRWGQRRRRGEPAETAVTCLWHAHDSSRD